MNTELTHLYNEITHLIGELQQHMDKHIQKGRKVDSKRARVVSSKLEKLFKQYRKLTIELSKKK